MPERLFSCAWLGSCLLFTAGSIQWAQECGRSLDTDAVAWQVENEYGYCGSDSSYIRHLVQLARGILGDDVILYTTDPPTLAAAGSLPGDEVYT